MTRRILVTNDDGIDAQGLAALRERLDDLGEVWVVAPAREMSATSHTVTLGRPLRFAEVGERRHTVEGTPTDCVFVAVAALMDPGPDLIVSGINRGGNVAADVTYSGPVGAAMEGGLRGIPAMAVSRNSFQDGDYAPAADIAHALAHQALERGLPADTFLNVNVPPLPREQIRGLVPTTQGRRSYAADLVPRVDPRGKPYHWIGGTEVIDAPIPGSDNIEVTAGYAPASVLTVDWTHDEGLQQLGAWDLERW